LVKIRQKCSNFLRVLNRHKSTVFRWNGFRLLE